MKTTFDKLAIGQGFNYGGVRYTKTSNTSADKHNAGSPSVNIAYGHDLAVTINTGASIAYLLREAAMASAAALRARSELLAALGDLTNTQRTVMDATVIELAKTEDPRSVGEFQADAMLARIAHSK